MPREAQTTAAPATTTDAPVTTTVPLTTTPAPDTTHKSGAAEAGEVARNQAPPHRLDWPINAMFILGIRKSKIKQNGYYLFFHFLLLNISHICRLTIIINSLLTFPTNTITIKFCNS